MDRISLFCAALLMVAGGRPIAPIELGGSRVVIMGSAVTLCESRHGPSNLGVDAPCRSVP